MNIFKYKTALQDIKNKQFIIEQIEAHKDTAFFKNNEIFINKYKQLCILISLNNDEQELTNGSTVIEDSIFYDKLNKINNYITNRMLLGDLLYPVVKKIPNSYSYAVKYKHFYNVYSKWWVFKNIIFYLSILTTIFFSIYLTL